MSGSTHSILGYLNASVYDYVSLAQSAAEADMLRFLAIYKLKAEHNRDYNELIRLNQSMTSWDFYHSIHDLDYQSPIDMTHKIADYFTELKFENELSLTHHEKDLCPYHPMLNMLPPLISSQFNVDIKALNCFKITSAQPFLDLDYRYFTTTKILKNQIHTLNHTSDRNHRLNTLAYVKRITQHPTFSKLNGQRGVFAKKYIPVGTIIDYYSGEHRQYPDTMPPMLCTWRVQKSHSWLANMYRHRKIARFNGWTDAFILGNMMKLVNSCHTGQGFDRGVGNIACYYFHFKSHDFYVSLPVYVAIKHIEKDSELLTFYPISTYKNKHIYGKNF